MPPQTPHPTPCSHVTRASSVRANKRSAWRVAILSSLLTELMPRTMKDQTLLLDPCLLSWLGEANGEKLALLASNEARMCEKRYVATVKTTRKAKYTNHAGLDHNVSSVSMSRFWDRPWLIEEKMRMRMTPRTMTAVPLMSDLVTAAGQCPSVMVGPSRRTSADQPACKEKVEDE